MSELFYYNDSARQSYLSDFTTEKIEISIAQNSRNFQLAFVESQLAGICIDRPDDDLLWLEWFIVHPAYRRRGIASSLLGKLEQVAQQKKCHKIWCDSRSENIESLAVLSRIGYRQICLLQNHWFGQDYFLWEKLVRW